MTLQLDDAQKEILRRAGGSLLAIDRGLSHVQESERGPLIPSAIKGACAAVAAEPRFGLEGLCLVMRNALVGAESEIRRAGIEGIARASAELSDFLGHVLMRNEDPAVRVDFLQAMREVRPALAQKFATELGEKDADEEVCEVSKDIMSSAAASDPGSAHKNLKITGLTESGIHKMFADAVFGQGSTSTIGLGQVGNRSSELHLIALTALVDNSDPQVAVSSLRALSQRNPGLGFVAAEIAKESTVHALSEEASRILSQRA